jgi:cytochrome c oxidase subunit II
MYNPTLFEILMSIGPVAGQAPSSGSTSVEAVPVAPGEVEAHAAQELAGATKLIEPGWVYPATQSEFANYIDQINNFINIVSVLCFVGIIAFMVYFAVKFRRRDPHQKALSQKSHNTALELSWTVPPLILVFIMFYLGFDGFLILASPPDHSYQVTATASKWAWAFTHPNARVDVREGEVPAVLHVPAGEPVAIQIESRDVLHSLFIPAFRVKKDAVPGRFTYLWFTALDPTPYHYDPHADTQSSPEEKARKLKQAADHGHILYCAEFCGTDHSNMWGRVVVHPRGWRPAAEDLTTESPDYRGEKYFARYGCVSCHQLQPGGPKLVGPNFGDGIFGKQERLTDGSTVTVDEEYLHESIRMPNAKVVIGHAPGQMPSQDHVPEDHVRDIIEFLKTIGKPAGEAPATQ